jgi:teichuronic acid biosynthesis glycosyltransferase TuaC
MRILMLSTLFPSEGRPRFGTFVEKRAQTIAQLPGVEVQVVAPIGLPPLGLGLLPRYKVQRMAKKVEMWDGIKVWRPRFRHIPAVEGRYDPALLARNIRPLLESIRKEFDFDIIDAQYFFPDAVAAATLGAMFNVPVTATARGSDINYWAQIAQPRRLILNAGQGIDGMIAVSEKLRESMIATGLNGDNIEVIYPGVDHDVFRPRDRTAAKAALGVSGPLVVSVGSIDNNKGQSYIIGALPQLPNVTYMLAGEGPMRAELQNKVAELGLEDRVHFLGSLNQQTVSDLLAAADVMCLPSANEGLSNAWLEALASGTPLVICDAGGAYEVMTDPVQGEIVSRDIGAIAAGIGRVIAAGSDRQAISNSVAHYTWAKKGENLMAHYERLISAFNLRSRTKISA